MTHRPLGGLARIAHALAWVVLATLPWTHPVSARTVDGPASPIPVSGSVVAVASASATLATGITFTLDGTSTQIVRSASVRYRAAQRETLHAASATTSVAPPGEPISLSLTVDPREEGLPPGLSIEYVWRLVLVDGTTWASEASVVEWIDDRFGRTSRSAGIVSVMVPAGDRSVRGDRILAEAVRALPDIERVVGTPLTEPVRLWVYDSVADLAGTRSANVEPWIAASSFPGLGITLAAIPPGDATEIGRLVPHELSHHVLHHAATSPFSPPPLWFDEGLASWFQTTGTEGFSALVAAAASAGTLPSVVALGSSFPFSAAEAQLAYAACWSVMTFVIETQGEAAVPRLAAALAADMTDDAAALAALGLTQADLDRAWRAWLAAGSHD